MPTPLIRPATSDELHLIKADMRKLVESDSIVLLALLDDQPVGSALLRWRPTGYPRMLEFTPAVPLLSNIDVEQGHRNRGIGTALSQAAERTVFEHGYKVLQLLIAVDNVDAARLYCRLGYVDWECGTLEGSCQVLVKTVTPGLPGLDAWEAWTPAQVAELLSGCPTPWCIAAGWAIELHLGYSARPHSDLEIAIPRGSFGELSAYLRRFDLHEVGDHQVWVCEQGKWRMDIFLEPWDEQMWISHRDDRVRLPLSEAIRQTPDGIPYLRPELVLFTKAMNPRPKDEADLLATLPTLDSQARGWLAKQIQLVYPGHSWLDRF